MLSEIELQNLTERLKWKEALEFKLCTPKTSDPEEVAQCCIRFINSFCYTFDPKREPYHFRFILFDFQKDLVRDIVKAIINGEDVFVDKCREMGATYTTLDVL